MTVVLLRPQHRDSWTASDRAVDSGNRPAGPAGPGNRSNAQRRPLTIPDDVQEVAENPAARLSRVTVP